MVPVYDSGPFFSGENKYGEGIVSPVDAHGSAERFVADAGVEPDSVTTISGKWWARLSAPGYMDCTDWSGPFDSEEEARAEIESVYDVDATTGDDLHAQDQE